MTGTFQVYAVLGGVTNDVIGNESNLNVAFVNPNDPSGTSRPYFAGDHGNDTIYGYAGDDTIQGGVSELLNLEGMIRDSYALDPVTGGIGALIGVSYQPYTENDDPHMDAEDGADIILSGAGSDAISGQGGNDVVFAGDDADYVYGNDGMDTLYGGNGNDYLYGAGGNYKSYDNTMRASVIYPSAIDDGAADVVFGGSGSDTINVGAGNDAAFGDAGADVMVGSAGNDILYGGYGFGAAPAGSTSDADVIYGGTGNDIIYCDAGNDVIIGEEGDDYIWDYGGSNVFAYAHATDRSGNDTIEGFEGAGILGGDLIMINSTLGLSAQQLVDATTYANGHATLHFGNSSVTIMNVGDHHLIADDFLIGLIS